MHKDKEGKKALNYKRDVERAKRMLGQLDPEPEVVEEKEEPMEIRKEPEVKTGLMARM